MCFMFLQEKGHAKLVYLVLVVGMVGNRLSSYFRMSS